MSHVIYTWILYEKLQNLNALSQLLVSVCFNLGMDMAMYMLMKSSSIK